MTVTIPTRVRLFLTEEEEQFLDEHWDELPPDRQEWMVEMLTTEARIRYGIKVLEARRDVADTIVKTFKPVAIVAAIGMVVIVVLPIVLLATLGVPK